MELTPTILISALGVAVAVYAAIRANKKDCKDETKSAAVEMTTVIVKLENIDSGIKDIKSDFKSMKTEFDSLRERVARCEESSKSAHKRLDEIVKIGEEKG
jgi:predicted nuclease with TOPRIM domain